MIFTPDTLPTYGVIRAYMTATAVLFPADGSDNYAEENGYVDPDHLTDVEESRNYVTPAAEWDIGKGEGWIDHTLTDDDDTPQDWARRTVRDILGAAEENGNGAFYGSSEFPTLTDPRTFSFALHFHVKHCDPARGWVEDPFTFTL